MKLKFILLSVLLAVFCSCTGKPSAEFADEPQCMDDIPDARFCTILGSLQEVELSKQYPGYNVLTLNGTPDLLAAVERGNADYCIIDNASLLGVDLKERGLKVLFSLPVGGDLALGFRYDEKELADSYNAFLRQLREDSVFPEIEERWTGGDIQSSVMPPIDIPSGGKELVVGVINSFPFDFFKDGEWSGFEVELARRFAAYLGRPLRFENYEFNAISAALLTRKVDFICSNMFVTEERSKQILFADPHYYSGTVCVGRDPEAGSRQKSFIRNSKESFRVNLLVEDRWKMILQGLWETIIISFFAILLGTVVGAGLCGMRLSRVKVLDSTARFVVEIVRGIPMLVFLMIMFYIVFASSGVTGRWVAIIAFAINFGAYTSEMFRTGIESIERGQTEAGLAMGFSPAGTFLNFILPQAVKKIVPVYKGEAISLIKNTSIVGYIAITDLTRVSDIIRSRTFDAFFPLFIVSILYFLLAWLLGRLLDRFA